MNETQSRVRRHMIFAFKLAGALVGVALLLALGRRLGYLDEDTIMRSYNVIMGVGFAAYFNAMPKLQRGVSLTNSAHATLAQTLLRVNSWVMTLAFVVFAAIWGFAPREVAGVASMAVMGTAIAICVAYFVWKAVAHDRSRSA